MSDDRQSNDEMREFMARLEREFQTRSKPPDEADQPRSAPTYRDPNVGRAAYPDPGMDGSPQRVELRLPLAPPRVVYVLLAINVVMYGVSLLLASRFPARVRIGGEVVDQFTAALYVLGAKQNAAINAGQWWRLLTPMVLHGSLLHLVFNSWALYALGKDVEQVYGTARFVTIYLLAGLAGSIASYAFNPNSLSVGASGAIFGLLGALAAFAFMARSLIGWEASRMQLGQMATLAVINLAFGFIPGSNIDNSAHIGGLIVGGLVGLALAPRYAVERRGYTPTLVQQGSVWLGWAVAALALVILIGVFVLVWLAQTR